METKTESRIQKAREMLKELSIAVRPLVREGAFDTINQAIIETAYRHTDGEVFKKFSEWVADGRRIKKGSKGYPVWARPREMKKDQNPNIEEDFSFYPICYLFSSEQIE